MKRKRSCENLRLLDDGVCDGLTFSASALAEAGSSASSTGVGASSSASKVEAIALPADEQPTVDAALRQWERASSRRAELRPVLEQELGLIQEILRCGFHGGDLRTLRRLVTGGDHGEADALRQDSVVTSMLDSTEKLWEILRVNHRALVELTAQMPQDREAIVRELDEARASLRVIQSVTHLRLMRAKEGSDVELVRGLGRSLNEFRSLLRKLEADRNDVMRNSRLARLLVAACRRILPARQIDPTGLSEIAPSREGFLKVLDYYFFTDASKYCFESYSGPNWFTRLKRNVAILSVSDEFHQPMYNQFAVSGVHQKPGAPLVPPGSVLKATEAEDEYGRVFDRCHDAEFKLLSDFVGRLPRRDVVMTGTLWTRKVLCKSCAGAVQQLMTLCPRVSLAVIEDVGHSGKPDTRRTSVVAQAEEVRETPPDEVTQ